ncbi:GNAT family N-acetyltransferase [Spirosoma agri]|uniref:GNAT family N-acetyltransferase n=1 Tax=Spirosoma agri TaxID=1987381 RepID=A0A6M0IQH5_9BACT|nr:GNAT family N-acetyltransferase [Spirosoma agri]NEU70304.1 GNAT family N-acetyltransferase [Spirosoma agri]
MIETDRLLIQKFTVDDAPFMLELLNTPAWLTFIGDRNVRTLDEARQYILNGALKSYEQFGFGSYVVKLKTNGTSIGLCGLFKRDTLDDVDIGFGFLPDYARSGYGYESASAVMAYATNTLGLTRITGLTSAMNQNSIRLLEKLGLRFEKKIMFRSDGTETLLFGRTLPGE